MFKNYAYNPYYTDKQGFQLKILKFDAIYGKLAWKKVKITKYNLNLKGKIGKSFIECFLSDL